MNDNVYSSTEALRRSAATPIVARRDEQGWALLGVILMLTIMSIFLASSVIPNVGIDVQREKEADLYYRGNQMAKAIAKYYNNGRLAPIPFPPTTPMGILTELKKIGDGITIGVNRFKLVRASDMIDPMTGDEWEPVRARDPRIMPFLNAFAVETSSVISTNYLLLAGPLPVAKDIDSTDPPGVGSSGTGRQSGGQVGGGIGRQPVNPNDPNVPRDPNNPNDPNDPDDDPFDDLFKDKSPIIGVATKRKGKAIRPLYGLKNYEEWIFLYIPNNNQQIVPR